jgi:hypothetical protein
MAARSYSLEKVTIEEIAAARKVLEKAKRQNKETFRVEVDARQERLRQEKIAKAAKKAALPHRFDYLIGETLTGVEHDGKKALTLKFRGEWLKVIVSTG